MKLSHSHIDLCGSSDDPPAGEGFATPTPLLPIVYEFMIAIHGTLESQYYPQYQTSSSWITFTYAPSTIQDDIRRKHQFWDQLHHIFNHYESEYSPILMGFFPKITNYQSFPE